MGLPARRKLDITSFARGIHGLGGTSLTGLPFPENCNREWEPLEKISIGEAED